MTQVICRSGRARFFPSSIINACLFVASDRPRPILGSLNAFKRRFYVIVILNLGCDEYLSSLQARMEFDPRFTVAGSETVDADYLHNPAL